MLDTFKIDLATVLNRAGREDDAEQIFAETVQNSAEQNRVKLHYACNLTEDGKYRRAEELLLPYLQQPDLKDEVIVHMIDCAMRLYFRSGEQEKCMRLRKLFGQNEQPYNPEQRLYSCGIYEQRKLAHLEGVSEDSATFVHLPRMGTQMSISDAARLLDPTRYRQPAKRSTPKVGRNDPCPCGSGKKYKKCCGR
ncbi:MAG: SEC-C domain-containing protein [Succinivibrio sp.]|nr:SEC-C domain-containing protein [Succinivibrio sp.]